MTKKLDYPISGFPELLPEDQQIFDDLIDAAKKHFRSYGFVPIETTALERLNVLNRGGNKGIIYIAKKQLPDKTTTANKNLGLRYDLTLPLARYVAQNLEKLYFPFKRYQVQRVWRGEKAQAGRYNEFYHFDIDVVFRKETNLYSEAEILLCVFQFLNKINIGNINIKIGNNILLKDTLISLGADDKNWQSIATISKKVDRIGIHGTKLLLEKYFPHNKKKINAIIDFFQQYFLSPEKFSDSIKEKSHKGIHDITNLYQQLIFLGINAGNIQIVPSLSRGLFYYTGNVYEFELSQKSNVGSICGGGRYDNLIQDFIGSPIPGLGISIGLSRLFERVLKKNSDKFNPNKETCIFIANNNIEKIADLNAIANDLRCNGLYADIYPDKDKLGTQIKYALNRRHTLAIIANKDPKKITIRNLINGKQEEVPYNELIEKIKSIIK